MCNTDLQLRQYPSTPLWNTGPLQVSNITADSSGSWIVTMRKILRFAKDSIFLYHVTEVYLGSKAQNENSETSLSKMRERELLVITLLQSHPMNKEVKMRPVMRELCGPLAHWLLGNFNS
jgi:hypothetical protein